MQQFVKETLLVNNLLKCSTFTYLYAHASTSVFISYSPAVALPHHLLIRKLHPLLESNDDDYYVMLIHEVNSTRCTDCLPALTAMNVILMAANGERRGARWNVINCQGLFPP